MHCCSGPCRGQLRHDAYCGINTNHVPVFYVRFGNIDGPCMSDRSSRFSVTSIKFSLEWSSLSHRIRTPMKSENEKWTRRPKLRRNVESARLEKEKQSLRVAKTSVRCSHSITLFRLFPKSTSRQCRNCPKQEAIHVQSEVKTKRKTQRRLATFSKIDVRYKVAVSADQHLREAE